MAVLLGEVVEHARDADPAFSPDAIPNAVALRAAVRSYRALHARAAATAREALAIPVEVVLPLVDFAEGAPLPEYVWIGPGDARNAQGHSAPFTLVDPGMRDTLGLGGWVEGGILQPTLHLLGCAQHWANIARVTVRMVPAVPEKLTPADPVLLPDGALEALVGATAGHMAKHLPGEGRALSAQFVGEGEAAAAAYLKALAVRRLGRVSQIRDAS